MEKNPKRIAVNTLEVQAAQLPSSTITREQYIALGGLPVLEEADYKFDHHNVTGGNLPADRPTAIYNHLGRKRGPVHYAD